MYRKFCPILQFRVVRTHDVSSGNVHAGGISWYRKFRYPSSACCMQRRNLLFLTVRFTLWGMLLCLPLGQLLLKKSAGEGKLFLGRENSRATPPLYEALND